jgi:hypothetical protein
LRTALAAIANAEALPATAAETREEGGEHVRGSVSGLAATEVDRRTLAEQEVAHIVEREIAERLTAADQYDALGQTAQAGDLRAAALVLRAALDGDAAAP